MIDTTSTFSEVGFLSEQMQECQAITRLTHFQVHNEVLELCRNAMTQLQALPNGEIERGHLLARVFWWRCIENSQATILLAERGMAISAASTARAAFEYLFYACALWRSPNLEPKVKQKDVFEAAKMLGEMGKYLDHVVSDEQRSELKKLMPNQKVTDTGLSTFDAAKEADLLDIYTVAYRGLSLNGAHSTNASAMRALPASANGGHDFLIGPDFTMALHFFESMRICLMTGVERLQELTNTLKAQTTSPSPAGGSVPGRPH